MNINYYVTLSNVENLAPRRLCWSGISPFLEVHWSEMSARSISNPSFKFIITWFMKHVMCQVVSMNYYVLCDVIINGNFAMDKHSYVFNSEIFLWSSNLKCFVTNVLIIHSISCNIITKFCPSPTMSTLDPKHIIQSKPRFTVTRIWLLFVVDRGGPWTWTVWTVVSLARND